MDIVAEIDVYDGKHTTTLEALAARMSPDPPVVSELCGLAGSDDPKRQAGATWLLKRFQESGFAYSSKQAAMLLDLLSQATHWEARLHLLQILPALDVPDVRKDALVNLLKGEGYLGGENKFVRAWSYNALACLATDFADLRDEVAELLARGQRDEAASVKARIRNIVKNSQWVDPTL